MGSLRCRSPCLSKQPSLTASSWVQLRRTPAAARSPGPDSVADKTLDFLAQNETVTLTYIATVNDHKGGIVTEPITVTIHGTNDAPVIKYTGSYSLDQFNTQDYGAWIEAGNNSNGAVKRCLFNGEFQVAHDPTTTAGNFQIRLTDLDAELDNPEHALAHLQSC